MSFTTDLFLNGFSIMIQEKFCKRAFREKCSLNCSISIFIHTIAIFITDKKPPDFTEKIRRPHINYVCTTSGKCNFVKLFYCFVWLGRAGVKGAVVSAGRPWLYDRRSCLLEIRDRPLPEHRQLIKHQKKKSPAAQQPQGTFPVCLFYKEESGAISASSSCRNAPSLYRSEHFHKHPQQ